MGIQILNKDVSIISSVMGKPKANIGNIFGTTGWAGGGDVTPNPTPNWANVTDPSTQSATVAVQQIQGITSTINLEVSRSGDVFKIYYKIDNSAPAWTNGGPGDPNPTWTQITSFPVIINVSNNQYVSFGCRPSINLQNATSTITVKNNSDSAIILDTFTATVSNEE